MTLGQNEDLQIELIERPSRAQLITLSGALILRTLFEFQAAARRHTGRLVTGHKFAISSVPERVQVLFDMTGVKGILPCFESLA